jgi:nitrite reductase (NO-forming)
VYTGAPETYIANEETWYVPPGSFAAFEFTLNEPGTYLLVDHALFRVAHGAGGALIVSGEHDETIYSPVPESSGHE